MKSRKKIKSTIKEKNIFSIYIKDQIFNLMIYIIIFVLSCLISLLSDVSESSIKHFSVGTFIVAGLICGYVSGFRNRKNGISVGLKSVATPIVFIIIISLIVNSFDISVIRTVISVTLMVLSGIVGGIAGVNTRIKVKKRG